MSGYGNDGYADFGGQGGGGHGGGGHGGGHGGGGDWSGYGKGGVSFSLVHFNERLSHFNPRSFIWLKNVFFCKILFFFIMRRIFEVIIIFC